MVTRRLRPLLVEGRIVHQIGLPFHWAFAGEAVGGNANDLTSLVADPNVSMHEGKAFACQVEAGRLAGRRAAPDGAGRRPGRRASPIPDTPRRRAAGREVRRWRVENGTGRTARGERPAAVAAGAAGPPRRAVPPRRRRSRAGHRLLHRHDGLHRLQGVRGRVQAVEPAPRRRLRLDRQQLRQHRRAVGDVLAARQVHRAVRRRIERSPRTRWTWSPGDRRAGAAG